jgi:hypothetical protein
MAKFLKLARLVAQLSATRKAPAPPPAPPAGPFQRALACAAHYGFALSLLISVALLFGLLAITTGAAWFAWLRIAVGLVLIVEGFLLATDWHGARRLTLWRLRRGETAGVALPLTHRLARRLASPVLQLLGVVWLGAGILAAALGLPQLV